MAYVGTVKSGSSSGVVNEGALAQEQEKDFNLAVKKANAKEPETETPPAVASRVAVKTNGAEADPKDPAWKKIEGELDKGKSANEIWFEAVKKKDADVVEAMIKYKPEGWNVDAVDNAGRTALHWAVLSQDLEMVQTLVEGRIDMAVIDEGGDSAYELAAEYAVNSNGGALQQIADYLKEALSGEAVAAYENGDAGRRKELVEAGADDPAPETPDTETLSADTKRPAGDTRSAAQIIAANPVLASLSDVDKEFLKYGYSAEYAKATFGITDLKFKGVGDFETDADAAYRAAKVLEHIQNFDEEGKRITGDTVSDGRIDGWTAERTIDGELNPFSEAKHGTEAGRFQDFIKEGYASLKGVSEPYEAPEPGEVDDYDALIKELDFREAETTEEVDGRKLTVQELALKEVLSDYKKRIDSGDIKKGSAEWKFFYAMQAKSDLANGRDLETHFEQQWAGTDSTSRDLGENKVPASGADMDHLLDSEKVDKAIEEALADPGVAEDFNKAMVSATTKVPGFNSEETTEKLRTILTSDGWKKHYEELKKVDPEKADAQLQQLYGAYSVLAGPEAASGLGAELTRDALAEQLEDILKDPGKIPDAEWEAATKDWITLALGYTTSGTFFTQEIANLARDPAFVKLLKDKDFNKRFAEIARRYAEVVTSRRGVTSLDRQIFNQQMKDLYSKSFTNLADRNKVTKWFDALNKNGFLSTATGWIAISSSINRLTDGQGLSGDPQENLSIANGFMFWLANGDAQLSFGRSTLKFLQSNLINVGQKVTAGLPIELTNWVKEITTKTPALPANVPNASGYVDKLKGMMIGPEGDKVKLASATGVVRILSSLGYTAFGALAMGIGGIGLAKAETPGERALAALQFASGVGFTGAGAAQYLNHVVGAKWAAAWISRLGFAGIFLSVIGTIVAEVVAEQKENKFQVDYFKSLEDLGLLKEGWGDKLEALTLYGYSEDMPELGKDQSIFDVYDMEQWLADYRKANEGNNSTAPEVPGLRYTQSAENSINAIVSDYGANIDLEEGTVPALEGGLRDQFRSLMTYYLVNIDNNDTAAEAAQWAVNEIRNRLGLAYESTGDTNKALEILDEWLTEEGGMEELTTLAGEIINEHKLTPDPDEPEKPVKSDRKPNGLDFDGSAGQNWY